MKQIGVLRLCLCLWACVLAVQAHSTVPKKHEPHKTHHEVAKPHSTVKHEHKPDHPKHAIHTSHPELGGKSKESKGKVVVCNRLECGSPCQEPGQAPPIARVIPAKRNPARRDLIADGLVTAADLDARMLSTISPDETDDTEDPPDEYDETDDIEVPTEEDEETDGTEYPTGEYDVPSTDQPRPDPTAEAYPAISTYEAEPSQNLSKRAPPGTSGPMSNPMNVAILSNMVTKRSQWARLSPIGTSASAWAFRDVLYQDAYGVNGLWGCTSVIVVSWKGVYISHIWEQPTFVKDAQMTPTDEETFWKGSFEALRDGIPATGSLGIKALTGTNGILHASLRPEIIIVTPRTTVEQMKTTKTLLFYQARVQKLATALKDLIPGAEYPSFQGYERTNQQMSEQTAGFFGRAIVEIFPATGFIACDIPQGKWRLWVGERAVIQRSFPNVPAVGSPNRYAPGKRMIDGDNVDLDAREPLSTLHPEPHHHEPHHEPHHHEPHHHTTAAPKHAPDHYTKHHDLPFTTTISKATVLACQSSKVTHAAGHAITECAGRSVTLSAPPTVTATLDPKSSVNVGTLTGDHLFASVTSALRSICPEPTGAGHRTHCKPAAATIEAIAYHDNKAADAGSGPEVQKMLVSAPRSSYDSVEALKSLINTIGHSISAAASGKSCKAERYSGCDAKKSDIYCRFLARHINFCSAPGLISARYSPPKHETSESESSDMKVQLRFDKRPSAGFHCKAEIGTVDSVLKSFTGPKASTEEGIEAKDISADCNVVSE